MNRLKRLFVAITALLLLNGCLEEKQESGPQVTEIPPLKVETVTVQKENVPIWLPCPIRVRRTVPGSFGR